MSTTINWLVAVVKSMSGKEKPKPELKPAAAVQLDSALLKLGNGLRRGRPTGASPGQVVSCRLPAEELQAFDALCTQLDAKSRSDGLRSIVRMASGFLEFSREDSARLEKIRYELGKISTNVNQIALAANRGRAPMVRAQWASIEELRRSLQSVVKARNQIIAERRRQSVALFRKFAETQGVRHG